jgi:hypothetical protein
MLRKKHLVLDEYVSSSAAAFSHERFNPLLGAFDQFALMSVVEVETGATGSFNLWVSHSADARLWLYRGPSPETTSRPASGNISQATTAATTLLTGAFQDNGNLPLLAFVRIEVVLTTATARVKVYAVQRDQGG